MDNTIQIEVLALLDPKSGGVVHEKEFAKALTKDLRQLISDTEKTLKELTINPALAVHPKYAGVKNKKQFVSAVRKDAKRLKKESEAVFKNMSIDAKMGVALNIDAATREFGRQLDALQRGMVAVAKSKGKRISSAISKELNLTPKALVNLQTLTKGQSVRLDRGARTANISSAGLPRAGNSAALGKELFKSVSGNIDKVADRHLGAVNSFLQGEQKKLIKLLRTTESTSNKVATNREGRLDAINSSLSKTNDRYRNHVRHLESMANHREQIKRTSDRINSEGVNASLKPENQSLGKDKLDAELLRERADYRRERNFLTDQERKSRIAYQKSVSDASRALRNSLVSSQNKEQLLSRRTKVNAVLGTDNPIKELSNYSRQQATTINKMHSLLNNSDVVRDGKLVTVDSSDAKRGRKALLTAFKDGTAQGLFSSDRQTKLFSELSKSTAKQASSAARTSKELAKNIAAAERKLGSFSSDPKSLSDDGKRLLLSEVRDAVTDARRLKKVNSADADVSQRFRRKEVDLLKGVKSLTDKIDNNLPDKQKQRVADRISKGLTGTTGNVSLGDKVTPANARFIKDLSASFKDTSLIDSVGKRFEDMTKDDFRRLNRWKDAVTKAQKLGIISNATARTAQERLQLAGARPIVGRTGNLAYSRQFQGDFNSGTLSGVNTASGLAQSKDVLGELRKEITATTKAQREGRVLQAKHEDSLRTNNSLDNNQREQLRKNIAALGDEYKRHGQRLSNLNRHYQDVDGIRGRLKDSASGRQIPTALGGGGGGANGKDNGSVSLLLRQFARLYLGFAVLGAAVGGVVALIGELATLDTNMKSVQAAALGTTEQMHEIRAAIKSVGITTKFTIGEISDAARVLVQADVPLNQIPSTLRATATLAAATDSDIGISADLLTSFSKVYSEYTPDQVASLLTKTFNLSKLNAEDLQTILGISTQTAKTMSLSGEQFLAAVSVLRNQGLKASTAATGLRQGLNEVFTPNNKTVGVLVERYAAVGENRSAEEIRRRFADFRDGMSPLVEVISELRRLGFGGSATKEFSRFINIRGENALNALARGQDDLTTKEFQLPFGDSATRASEIQLQGITATIKNLGAAITVLADSALEPLLDLVKTSARGLTSALLELDNANTRALSEGRSGIGSTINTSILGGVAGAALTRGKSVGARVGGVAAGSVLGGSIGAASLSADIDVAKINAGLLSILSVYEAYTLFSRKSSKVLGGATRGTVINLTKANNAVGKVASSLSTLKTVGSKLITGIGRFLGPIAFIAFSVLPTLVDLFSTTSVEDQAKAMNKAILDSKARIQAAKQAAEQFTSTSGATAASVYEAHATAVKEFNKTVVDAGVDSANQAELTALVQSVIEEGLDANNSNYKTLATYLETNSTLSPTDIGDYIRTFHNLQQASTNSLKAAVEQTKSVIAGIKDKLQDGQAVSTVETEMLSAWESMIYGNADLYTLFMGDLTSLSASAVKDATGLLAKVQAAFNSRLSKAYSDVKDKEQKDVDAISKVQSIGVKKRLREVGTDLRYSSGDSVEEVRSTAKEFLKLVNTELKNLNALKKSDPTTKNIADIDQRKTALKVFSDKILKAASFSIQERDVGVPNKQKEKVLSELQVLRGHVDLALTTDANLSTGQIAGATKLAVSTATSLKTTLVELQKTFKQERDSPGSKSTRTLASLTPKFSAKQNELLSFIAAASPEEFAKKYLISDQGVLSDDLGTKANVDATKQVWELLKQNLVKSDKYQTEVKKSLRGSDESNKFKGESLALKLQTRKDGRTPENVALVESKIALDLSALKSKLTQAEAILAATPKKTDVDNFSFKDLEEAKQAVEKLKAEIASLPDKKIILLQGLDRRKPRERQARDTSGRDQDRLDSAIATDLRKKAADELRTLKKRLANTKFDDTLSSEGLKKALQDRANILVKINQKELARDAASAVGSEKYLDAKRQSAAKIRREAEASSRLAEEQKKNSDAYAEATAKLIGRETDDAIKKIERDATPLPTFLSTQDQSKDSQKELLQAALQTKQFSALLKTLDPNNPKLKGKRDELLAKIVGSSQTMADKLQGYIGNSQFGRQLELMNSLIAVQATNPVYESLARLPDTLANAVISPFFDTPDDDSSLGDRIIESLKTGFRAEAQNIATEYFKQGIAGGMEQLLGGLFDMPEDEALSVQRDLKKAMEGDTKAVERLTVVMKAIGEGGDVTSALAGYDRDNPDAVGGVPDNPQGWFNILTGGDDGELKDKNKGVITDLQDGFSALFAKDGNLFSNIGGFFSEIFGEGSSLSGLFDGLFGGEGGFDIGGLLSDGGDWLSGLFSGGGDWFSSLFSGGFSFFDKGVAGYGRISGKKGKDKIPGLGISQGKASPIFVGDGESILTESASKMLGYQNIDAMNAGAFTAQPMSVDNSSIVNNTTASPPPLNVSVEPGTTQVFVGSTEIEKAMNTRAGRQAIAKIVKENK